MDFYINLILQSFMQVNKLFLEFSLVLGLLLFFLLLKTIRRLVLNQIDDQMKKMIPLKAIRKRIKIRIRLK